ncbi:hypothetical protein RchiOBHm_Chr1g0337101 [Rosa chinensis]|uniref:Uncharacterized protein n=1 Tax=Rosa chinensis TaxID=74649 RepID=A0A2P6SCU8_ROSCH|nr:hypothetical protein RchiOBHm_Chr1g0337101 [Rosa chinensis]
MLGFVVMLIMISTQHALCISRRAAHTSVYDKNPDEQICPSFVHCDPYST